MKVTGIITEYNPFHKGHKYQIDMLRQLYHPDYIVVAMSGDFMQRGTPALMDKYSRAQMVLKQGADIVFELPTCFATASAEIFARGGILLFETTGLTDSLCFGAESNDLEGLVSVSQTLIQEPDWYQDALLSYLKEGLSYPAARAKALPEFAQILDTPNNILAIEYLKSINALNSNMEPILIQRSGSGYHDTDINGVNASASAIRNALQNNSLLPDTLPKSSYEIMSDYKKSSTFLWENDFSLLLHHKLLNETSDSLMEYLDMTDALKNKILNQRNSFTNWSSFCEACKSKDVTYSRISRVLTHMLLNIKKEDMDHILGHTTLPYLRILGFRQSATPLLTELKKSAKAPIITSCAAGEKVLDQTGLAMLKADIYAADLYRSVLTAKTGNSYSNEYQRKLLIV